jgi:hypothetical protein
VIPLLVYRTVVPATEHREVGERGGAAIGPVPGVMAFPERESAAREAAAAVAVVQRAPQRRRNRPRASPDLHHAPVRIMAYHHTARIARQAAGRFL